MSLGAPAGMASSSSSCWWGGHPSAPRAKVGGGPGVEVGWSRRHGQVRLGREENSPIGSPARLELKPPLKSRGRALAALTETLQQTGEQTAVRLNVTLEAARTAEELRAAATLRARSFYAYPEGRSPAAEAIHQKMKADDEWATLSRKVAGVEPGYFQTSCFVAVCPVSDLLNTDTDLQSSCKINSPDGTKSVVVGTVDIYQGLVLPGELLGDYPQGPKANHCRAYLSNVCVAQEVRRRGVGLLLMQHVMKITKLWGVTHLYVHVVVDNLSARQLYDKAGFIYEKEESVKYAKSIARPRRYLLRAQL